MGNFFRHLAIRALAATFDTKVAVEINPWHCLLYWLSINCFEKTKIMKQEAGMSNLIFLCFSVTKHVVGKATEIIRLIQIQAKTKSSLSWTCKSSHRVEPDCKISVILNQASIKQQQQQQQGGLSYYVSSIKWCKRC